MDTLKYYISKGIWNIFDAIIAIPLTIEEKSRLHNFLWNIALYPEKFSFPSEIIDTPYKQSLAAISLLRKLIGVDGHTISSLTITDLNNLQKDVEFQSLLFEMHLPGDVKKELVDLYHKILQADKVKQPVRGVSAQTLSCLKDNLITDTVRTDEVIQNLLCLWCPHFTQSDNQLQDVYKQVIWCCIHCLESGTTTDDAAVSCDNGKREECQDTLLCLLSITNLSEEKNISLSEWLGTRLDKLCLDGHISRRFVYMALISRGNLSMLHTLLQIEDERLGRGNVGTSESSLEKRLSLFIHPDGRANVEELFYYVMKSKKHWVEEIVAICMEFLARGNYEKVEHCLSCPGLTILWPVLLLYAWNSIADHPDVFKILMFLLKKSKEIITEETFSHFLLFLEHQLTLLQWIKKQSFRHKYSYKTLLSFVGKHSSLEIIRKTTNVATADWDEIREMLTSDSPGVSDWEIVVFNGACALITAFKIIEAGMEIEEDSKRLSKTSASSSKKNDEYFNEKDFPGDDTSSVKTSDETSRLQYLYIKSVKGQLQSLKQIINSIFPLTFRIEILENIFSLLFLRYEDIRDESSSESGAEEDEPDISTHKVVDSEESPEQLLSSQETASVFLKNIPVIEAQQASSIIDQTSVNPPHNKTTDSNAIPKEEENKVKQFRRAQSSATFSSEGSYYKNSHGFVCNKFIVRDLLHCLKECLANCSSTFYGSLSHDHISKKSPSVPSSVKPETLQQRMNKLSQHVSEAMWRLLLLTSEEFVRHVGEIPACGILQEVEEELWYYPVHDSSSDSEDDGADSVTRHPRKPGHHNRLLSDPEKSSGSGSQSAATITGSGVNATDKNKQRRKHSKRLSVSISRENSIVSLMLSSQTSLAHRCIAQGNHVKAKEVIQMFESEGNPLATEVKFTEAYETLKKNLLCHLKSSQKKAEFPQPTKSHSLFQSIRQAAEAGAHTTSLTSLVETFLSVNTCPSVPGSTEIIRDFPQYCTLLHGVNNPAAIAAMDLALTCGSTFQHSVSLLDIVCKHCPEICTSVHETSTFGSQSFETKPGVVNFMERMIQCLKIVNKETSVKLPSGVFPDNISLCDMLNAPEIPLHPKKLQKHILLLHKFTSALDELRAAIDNKSFQDSKRKPSASLAIQKLIQVCNAGLFSSDEQEKSRIPYLHSFYRYVRVLWSLENKFLHDEGAAESGRGPRRELNNCFDILHQSVTDIIRRLVFERHIPPASIEPELKRLGISLVSNIIKICCPYIPGKLDVLRCSPPKNVIILNGSSEVEAHPVKSAEVTVRSLLSDVLGAIQKCNENSYAIITYKSGKNISHSFDVKNVLEKTKELATVDLSRLITDEERVGFLVNLSNLLYVHTFLTIDLKQSDSNNKTAKSGEKHAPGSGLMSECPIEKLMAKKSLGYRVGNIEFLSLYNMQQQLLGRYFTDLCDNVPVSKEMEVQRELIGKSKYFGDPRLLFVLADERAHSPKLQVFQVEHIDSQLDSSIIEYINNTVKVTGNLLEIPEFILNYIKLYSSQKEHSKLPTFEKLEAVQVETEEILNFLQHNSSGYLHDQLVSLQTDVIIQFIKSDQVGITLSYVSEEFNSTSHSSETPSLTAADVSWNNYGLGEPLLKYLENQCWILSVLVQKIHEGHTVPTTPVRRNSSDETIDRRTRCLDRLLESDWITTLSGMYNDNRTLAALHFVPPHELLWSYLNELVKNKDWVKCVDTLWALPYSVDKDPKLRRLFDIALYKLASSPESSLPEYFSPWWYSEHIHDANLQADCIFANIRNWPTSACKHMLIILLEKSLPPDVKENAQQTLTKIKLYEKILAECPIPSVTSWYELSTLSIENPGLVMSALIKSPLCIEWVKLHDICVKSRDLIDTQFLFLLFQEKNVDYLFISELLESLPPSQAISISKDVIYVVKTIPHLKFIITYVLNSFKDILTPDDLTTFNQFLISIEVLKTFPPEEQDEYLRLAGFPLLIVEELLMNMRMEMLEKVIKVMMQYSEIMGSVNNLLKKYASKALDLGVYYNDSSTKSSSSEHKSLTSQNDPGNNDEEFMMPSKPPDKSDWMPDEQVAECKCCKAVVFSMFNRRHHCRRCGRVICSTCSTWKMQVEGYGDVAVRVCNNCYEQTQNPSISSKRKSTCPTLADIATDIRKKFLWKLSPDELYSCTVRDEFSYEHAPSASLCLSIIKYCSEDRKYCSFLMDSCNSLMLNLWDEVARKATCPQLDYNLILYMIRSVAIAAKVKYSHLGDHSKVDRCDVLLSEVDLMSLLVDGGCTHLLPMGPVDDTLLRRIRDQLVEEELWKLALDVSTKGGLDKSGIWAAWGKACLRAGCWEDARERFSHCLEKVSGASRDPPLLTEIINILESGSSNVLGEYWKPLKAKALLHTKEPKVISSPVVMTTLAALKDIAQGNYPQAAPVKNVIVIGPKINPLFYEECQYYLSTYGTSAGMLKFYLKHDDLSKALKYVLSQQVEPEVFFECVYLRCLRENQISDLHNEISLLDTSLDMWRTYLQYTCSRLARKNFFHVLYELQVFMKDYVRAAMTSIRFFSSEARNYSDLASNMHYLHQARQHLKTELAVTHWGPLGRSTTPVTSSLTMKMEPKELNRHLNTIERQLEITKFLQNRECRYASHSLAEESSVPTLFGNNAEKIQVAVTVTLCGKNVDEGFGLTYRIIQDYHLNALQVYVAAAKTMATAGCINDIEQLVKCIHSSGASDTKSVCDHVIVECVETLSSRPDCGDVEPLIKLIDNAGSKIGAFIKCRQLKSAYLTAVKFNKLEDIKIIQAEAKRLGQLKIEQICSKRLGQS